MTNLRVEDARTVFRLINEISEHGEGAPRDQILSAACGLVRAEAGMGCQSPLPLEYPPRIKKSSATFGWNPRQASLWQAASSPAALKTNPTNQAAEPLRSKAFTLVRRSLVDDATWYRSSYVGDHMRAIGADDHIVSVCPTREGLVSALALYRPWGDTAFTEREVAIVNLFHEELCWKLARPAPRPDPEQLLGRLAPRLRDTLNQLLTGASEKEIAVHLGISAHTVHDYVKAIHRELGVRSRGELLSRFIPDAADSRR